MTKLRPFFITVIFITERKPRNAQFSVLVVLVDPKWIFQFQKQVIIKNQVRNDQVTFLLYNYHFYYRNEAQQYPIFYSGCVSGSRMVVPIPKPGNNRKRVKMTKLRPFCITVIFITERKPRNTQFYVLVAWVDS